METIIRIPRPKDITLNYSNRLETLLENYIKDLTYLEYHATFEDISEILKIPVGIIYEKFNHLLIKESIENSKGIPLAWARKGISASSQNLAQAQTLYQTYFADYQGVDRLVLDEDGMPETDEDGNPTGRTEKPRWSMEKFITVTKLIETSLKANREYMSTIKDIASLLPKPTVEILPQEQEAGKEYLTVLEASKMVQIPALPAKEEKDRMFLEMGLNNIPPIIARSSEEMITKHRKEKKAEEPTELGRIHAALLG